MAAPQTHAMSDDFLRGQGVPVALKDIEAELTRLWGPAAEQVGGPELEHPNVTRVVLANLVVAALQEDVGRLQGVLETVASRYPTRTIVLLRTDQPGRSIGAEVSALCHLPAPGLPQVCSERIVLRAGPEGSGLLAGAVRPLLEADLPFVLWLAADPRIEEAVFRDIGDECTRLILDLPDPGTDPAALRLGLDPTICPHARDAAWFGITRWRELIASFFDPPAAPGTVSRIDAVRVEVKAPPSPGPSSPPRLAVWLAAWLAGQLGWTPDGSPERSGGSLRANFRGPTGPVALEVRTETDPAADGPKLQGVVLTTRPHPGADGGDTSVGPEVFKLVRVDGAVTKVRVEVSSPSHCALPRTVVAPDLDAAHRISAALESSRLDPPFQNALPVALWLLGG